MRNGLVVKRGVEFLARKGKKVRIDEAGYCWSEDIQKARVFLDHDHACKAAWLAGGVVKTMKDGKAVD